MIPQHHLAKNPPGVNWPQAKRGQRPLPARRKDTP